MNKISKYWSYFKEYWKYSDYQSIIDSVNYVLFKKGGRHERITNGYLGKMKLRKGTNDFQFVNYYYEWGVKSYLLRNAHRYDVFIDLGAGIGDYSMLMAQKGLKVIAFEPVEDSFRIFDENIHLNGFYDEIKAYQMAIGQSAIISDFIVTPVNTGASHRADIDISDAMKKGAYKQKTVIGSLDELYPEFKIESNEKILLKMDIEGMETEAIKGARDFFHHFNKITVIAEAKHSGEDNIVKALNSVALFEYGEIDEFNIWARKIGNH